MLVARTRHRFSVADYDQLIEYGILTENDRVELIRGEIVEKMSIGDLHAAAVRRLTRLLTQRLSSKASISVQNPVRLDDSEPEPDVAVLLPRDDDYAAGHPGPADVLLIIEVADTSLEYDREVKGPLYAENGVVEYWILDLPARTVEIRRQPRSAGGYAEVRVFRGEEPFELAKVPGVSFSADELLPPVKV